MHAMTGCGVVHIPRFCARRVVCETPEFTGAFDLVMSDRGMSPMSGDELAAAVKQIAPQLPVILLTGFGAMMNAVGEQPAGVDAVLSKPLSLTELRAAIITVTARAAAPVQTTHAA